MLWLKIWITKSAKNICEKVQQNQKTNKKIK